MGICDLQSKASLVRSDSLVRHHHRANVWNEIVGTDSFKEWVANLGNRVHGAITPIGACPKPHSSCCGHISTAWTGRRDP